MKVTLIREPVLKSRLCFIYNCTMQEYRKYVLEKFNHEESEEDNQFIRGECLMIRNETKGTMDWIIWADNIVSLAHEIIHFVKDVFKFQKMRLSTENEEVFCCLHSYYFEECLKLVDKKWLEKRRR